MYNDHESWRNHESEGDEEHTTFTPEEERKFEIVRAVCAIYVEAAEVVDRKAHCKEMAETVAAAVKAYENIRGI